MKQTQTTSESELEYSPDRLKIILERSVQMNKAVEDFASDVPWPIPRVRSLMTDIIDVCKRFPHREARFDKIFHDKANHVAWTSLVDILRGSPMRTESADLPLSGHSYSIGSGWFTTYFRRLLLESSLFEIYRDPHHKRTERVRFIHYLNDELALHCFHNKRVRIMQPRPDIWDESGLFSPENVGRTGKAIGNAPCQKHGDAYDIELDPVTQEEITKPLTVWTISEQLEPLF